MSTLYNSYRESTRGWYKTALPVSSGDSVKVCVDRTKRYLGYTTDFFVVNASTNEEVFKYTHKEERF